MTDRGSDGFRCPIVRGERRGLLQNVFGDCLEPVTLCLTRVDDPDPGILVTDPEIDAPLVGDLNYGTIKGLETAVLFDWVNGLLLTLPCGNVSLGCTYPAIPAAPVNLRQQVGVLVACGNRPASTGSLPQARFTTRLGLLAPAAVVTVAAPKRSHAVRLLTTRPDLYGTFRLGSCPAIAAASANYFYDPTDDDEMVLAAGTRAVSVTNFAAVGVSLTLLWSLAL